MLEVFDILESALEKNWSKIQSPKWPHLCRHVGAVHRHIRHPGTICRWNGRSWHGCRLTNCLPHRLIKNLTTGSFIKPFKLSGPKESQIFDKVFPDEVHEIVRKWDRKQQRIEKGKQGQALDTVLLCQVLCLCIGGCQLNPICLIHQLIMGVQRQVSKVINLNGISLVQDIWVVRAITRNIVSGCIGIRDTKSNNFAHATRRYAIMTLHMHKHWDSWDVTKYHNEKCTKRKDCPVNVRLQSVKCPDTLWELQQLLNQRPKEGIDIGRLLQPGYDTKWENVVKVETDIRRKIVIEQDEWPCSTLATFMGSKAIGWQTESNVSKILKMSPGKRSSIDVDLACTQVLIPRSIKDVGYYSWGVFMLTAIAHLLCHIGVGCKHDQMGNEGHVHELLVRLAIHPIMLLSAVRTVLELLVGSRIAAAWIWATVIELWHQPREKGHSWPNFVQAGCWGICGKGIWQFGEVLVSGMTGYLVSKSAANNKVKFS